MVLGIFRQRGLQSNSLMDTNTNWEDVTCPICLDFPHNGVLLQCSSYEKGCRPFMCDTDHTHSNCLERFRTAYGMSATKTEVSGENTVPILSDHESQPTCPLCRGNVTGWIVVEEARVHLNIKERCCEEKNCNFVGNYLDLQKHAKMKHPHSRPSEIDPARKLDWEHFQQSSEIIDVISTIHSEVPRAVVLGDYVIEYGDDDTGDEYEDFPGDDGNWWTSCILYQVFENFRASRNRRRSRVAESRRGNRRSSYESSVADEGSSSSVDTVEYRFDETDDEFMSTAAAAAAAATAAAATASASRGSSSHRSSRRRRSRFQDH